MLEGEAWKMDVTLEGDGSTSNYNVEVSDDSESQSNRKKLPIQVTFVAEKGAFLP